MEEGREKIKICHWGHIYAIYFNFEINDIKKWANINNSLNEPYKNGFGGRKFASFRFCLSFLLIIKKRKKEGQK